ncbi:helicase-like protein [Senna tora]|uniref:Helicase-like protein n=1 Tax=Senna tora TaxID=362788 RepID=A0A834VZ36_9FABA|nr:helicase-like protein [Senna tora]
MRLLSQNSSHDDEVKEFAYWLLKVGEGKINEPNDGEVEIQIPYELLITDFTDPLVAIVSSTYPSLEENYANAEYLKDRAILAPTLEIVEKVNQLILSQVLGLPPHQLSLKVGTSIMLMRNIDQSLGLCNGTSLFSLNLTLMSLKPKSSMAAIMVTKYSFLE